MTAPQIKKLMLVDDSVVVRGLLRQIIEKEENLEIVATAMDGRNALRQYQNHRPDIVLMDIEMPIMNGIESLTEILKIDPHACIIMCSSLTQKGATLTVQALELGAYDYLTKPTTTSIDRGDDFKNKLIKLLNSIQRGTNKYNPTPSSSTGTGTATTTNTATLEAKKPYQNFELEKFSLRSFPNSFSGSSPQAIVIGSSTGGPKALTEVITNLSPNRNVPIFITQHMPEGFTKLLAESLSRHSGYEVQEAAPDMLVKKGGIYLAKGGAHMVIERRKAGIYITLDNGPAVNHCKPAVDVMMDSVLKTYETGIIALIMTGMGEDGLKSCERIASKSDKNIIIGQDQTTSVVWSMPGAIIRAGICHGVIPMSNIAAALNKLMNGQRL